MNITTLMVTHNTRDMTRHAYETFREFYPEVDFILFDNGSFDGTYEMFTRFMKKDKSISWVLKAHENKGHGPALDFVIRTYVTTDFFFTLDSDTITRGGMFLEPMLSAFAYNPNLYAIGWLRNVNRNGVSIGATVFDSAHHCPYVHPAASVYDREKYLSLPPFNYDGAPANLNMWAARDRGYAVLSFPIWDYVTHLVAGTRRMYGGRWNPKENEPPNDWNPGARFPI